ncbi:MAG: N-acetylmuramoyl-L-alanine amidase [Sphingobacteriales bacterium]|nr:MAG: N-acetylmuramoyl-L-alanine amidase [Sphingobacteriales bacterium]
MKIKLLLLLLALGVWTPPSIKQGYKMKTIVIDPGHGGRKPGAAGATSLEKNVALKIGLLLAKKFEAEMPGLKIILTRKTDIDVDLYKRADIANTSNADLFISIHCNSMPPKIKGTRGTETLVAGMGRIDEQDAAIRENADIKLEKNYKQNYSGYDPSDPETFIILSLMKNAFRDKSIKLAKYIQNNYTNNNKRVNRGVKEQNVLVLQRCGMPSVLTEVGFINNPEEEKYMNSDLGQNEIVNAIFDAVKLYKKEIEN